MKLVEVNWNPTNSQLRQFGTICLFALPLIGWIWGAHATALMWLGGTGLALAVLGLVAPKAIKPVFLALTIAATPIGIVLGEIAMLLIFFGVFLPIGLIYKMMNHDPLQRKLDRDATTYWQDKPQPRNVASYYRQS